MNFVPQKPSDDPNAVKNSNSLPCCLGEEETCVLTALFIDLNIVFEFFVLLSLLVFCEIFRPRNDAFTQIISWLSVFLI